MEKDHNISQEAKLAIENFVSQFRGVPSFVYYSLLASLYAELPNKNEKVWSVLKEYCEDLDHLTEEKRNILRILQNEYREVVRFCVSSERKYSRPRLSHSFIIPREAVDLFTTMVSPAIGSEVLLPYSCPEIYAYLSNEYKCYGYVTLFWDTQKEWALSQMLSDAFNVDAKISNCRFTKDHNGTPKQYDYIFAFPSIYISGSRIGEELTTMAKDCLKDNGEMFCVLPYEFTCKPEWENLRKTIVDACFEIKVITLYASLYGGREICVVHLKKTHTGNIMLVDGLQLFREINFSFGSTKSEAEYLIEAIERDKGEYVWRGDATGLKQDYDLRPAIYIVKLPIPQEGEKLMKMGDLVEVIEDDDIPSSDKEYPIVTMDDLSNDYLKCDDIELDTLENSSKGNVYSLCGGYLFFSPSVVDMLVAKLSVDNKKIMLDMGIIPMKLKSENVITEEFLLRALTLEETSKQALSYAKDVFGIHSELSTKDFLKLQILVPSLERQREICLEESRARLSEADRKLLEAQKKFRNDRGGRRHAIGQTISEMEFELHALQTICQKDKDVAKESDNWGIKNLKSIAEIYDVIEKTFERFAEIYDAIEKTFERLKLQVSLLDCGYNMESEEIALTEYIETYIRNHPHIEFRYVYEHWNHHFEPNRIKSLKCRPIYTNEGDRFLEMCRYNCVILLKEGDPIEWVKFPSEALEKIFNNIINNACAHGFNGRKDENNKVKIELYPEGLNYVITIANNGNPPHPQFDNKKVFNFGYTTQWDREHSGIGAHEVSEFMREFGGEVEFISTPSEEYKVTYKLTFGNTNIMQSSQKGNLVRSEEPKHVSLLQLWDSMASK